MNNHEFRVSFPSSGQVHYAGDLKACATFIKDDSTARIERKDFETGDWYPVDSKGKYNGGRKP